MEGVVDVAFRREVVSPRDEILCALAGALAGCVRLGTRDLRNTPVDRGPHRENELVVKIAQCPPERRQTKRHLEGLEKPCRGQIPALVEEPQGKVHKRGEMAPQEVRVLLPKPCVPLVKL